MNLKGFKSAAELYDYIEKEARRRAVEILIKKRKRFCYERLFEGSD
jgi:hypothetical protein